MNLSLPAHRIAVKICGITNRADALAAIEAGADLLGFNTWRGTRRHIDLEQNADWISKLPVARVALLVNATADEARRVSELPFVDALQLHGDEDAAYCAFASGLGKPLIKAIRTRDATALVGADGFSTRHILLDALVPGSYGGTGARVDGEVVRAFQRAYPDLTMWLAGGLSPTNVGGVAAEFHPAVVDVSSGVENQAGLKDFAKMREFVEAVRKSS